MHKSKLLGIPGIIWVLQLVYVALAVGLFALLSTKLDKQVHQLLVQVAYVIVIVLINITWLSAIKKFKPEWF